MTTAEQSMAMSIVRRWLEVATVKAQSTTMLGRLEVLGPGTGAVRAGRKPAATLEHQLGLEQP